MSDSAFRQAFNLAWADWSGSRHDAFDARLIRLKCMHEIEMEAIRGGASEETISRMGHCVDRAAAVLRRLCHHEVWMLDAFEDRVAMVRSRRAALGGLSATVLRFPIERVRSA